MTTPLLMGTALRLKVKVKLKVKLKVKVKLKLKLKVKLMMTLPLQPTNHSKLTCSSKLFDVHIWG